MGLSERRRQRETQHFGICKSNKSNMGREDEKKEESKRESLEVLSDYSKYSQITNSFFIVLLSSNLKRFRCEYDSTSLNQLGHVVTNTKTRLHDLDTI